MKKKYQNRLEVFYKLGEVNHIQKKYETAIKYFSTAISKINETDEKYWYLFYSRGMSYERSSKWELAEKDFLKALKLKPDQPLTLNYLGYSWIDLGKNIDEAHKLIQKAVKLRPNDGYFVDSLGWAYYRMGQYKKAVSELEKAVSLVPNDPIINDHLGDAMWRAGYKYEAIYQWKRALIYKPDDELENKIKFKLKKVYKLRLKTFNYISSKAFAKINLSLRVLGKTQDHYHSIESIITFLPDIYDCVMIKKSQEYKINITGKFSKTLNIEGGDTLVKNLVFLFKEKFNIPYNFNVIIKKIFLLEPDLEEALQMQPRLQD